MLIRLLVLLLALAGCSQAPDPQWQLSLSAARATTTSDTLTMQDPDVWAVAVAHAPTRMGAVLSTQRLVSEWPDLLGDDPVPALLNGTPVTVGAPRVAAQNVEFPTSAAAAGTPHASLVMGYNGDFKYFFDLPPAAGWTYTLTFGPLRRDGTTLVAQATSPVTVAFEGDRSRNMPSEQALTALRGPSYLVLLDSRTYSAVPVTLTQATLDGDTLTLRTQDSAPRAAFNRGALFVDVLPCPA